ncbi:hypothetical protein ABH916_001356 [Peribacillus frigoritolerans]|uniref:hypothetical protein n=1 Tax=Peribacillus frigoritolerans TaxID=450367 RepID=UPI003838648E
MMDAVDTVNCNEFVSVIHLKGNTPIKRQGIGQESYEEKEPVVKLVPSDYIIQAAVSLALYKEGSGEEFSCV